VLPTYHLILLVEAIAHQVPSTKNDFKQTNYTTMLHITGAIMLGLHRRCVKLLFKEFLHKQPQAEVASQAQWNFTSYFLDDIETELDPSKMTGLHLAAFFVAEETVRDILIHNSPDPRDSEGQIPLLLAITGGWETVVQLLLEKGAKIDEVNFYGQTPLRIAVEAENEEVVQLLLNGKSRVERRAYWSQAILSLAVMTRNQTIVKLLLEDGAEIETGKRWDQIPLIWAVEKGFKTMVQFTIRERSWDRNKG
jgi:hypothetical protein